MNATKILSRIIEKGGIIGKCAEIYSTDIEKADLYICECHDHINTESCLELWGNDLIKEIKKYYKNRKRPAKDVDEFSFLIARGIKSLRKYKGIKQGVVAETLNMTQNNYSRIEDGLRPLTLGQFNVICKALDVSISEIILFSTDEKNSNKLEL